MTENGILEVILFYGMIVCIIAFTFLSTRRK